MHFSERTVKWGMCLYPPLFFNRIYVKKIEKGFRHIEVGIYKSILNKNYNKTIFGGTIFSAIDPFLLIMYWQNMNRLGIKVKSWVKSVQIDYVKPAKTNLSIIFKIEEEDIKEAFEILKTGEKYLKTHKIEAVDKNGEICAKAYIEIYLRKPWNKNK